MNGEKLGRAGRFYSLTDKTHEFMAAIPRCGKCDAGFNMMTWTVEEGVWVCPKCDTKHLLSIKVVSNE